MMPTTELIFLKTRRPWPNPIRNGIPVMLVDEGADYR